MRTIVQMLPVCTFVQTSAEVAACSFPGASALRLRRAPRCTRAPSTPSLAPGVGGANSTMDGKGRCGYVPVTKAGPWTAAAELALRESSIANRKGRCLGTYCGHGVVYDATK